VVAGARGSRGGTVARRGQGVVLSGFASGIVNSDVCESPKKLYRGTARENTRTSEARLAATSSGASVASLGWMTTERNMSVNTRRMWIPRPMDWSGRSETVAPPGNAMNASAATTAARYPRRYVHREVRTDSTWGVAIAVAMITPGVARGTVPRGRLHTTAGPRSTSTESRRLGRSHRRTRVRRFPGRDSATETIRGPA